MPQFCFSKNALCPHENSCVFTGLFHNIPFKPLYSTKWSHTFHSVSSLFCDGAMFATCICVCSTYITKRYHTCIEIATYMYETRIALNTHNKYATLLILHCYMTHTACLMCTCVYSRYITKGRYPCLKYVLFPVFGSDAPLRTDKNNTKKNT